MKLIASSGLYSSLGEVIGLQLAMPLQQELGLAIAMVLTFLGMVMHWRLPRQRMAMEEQMKDGKMTEMQARRRLRLFNWFAPAVTLTGIALLLGAMLAFAE
jgi:hypothetical protein